MGVRAWGPVILGTVEDWPIEPGCIPGDVLEALRAAGAVPSVGTAESKSWETHDRPEAPRLWSLGLW
jgi:hypothetical protein